MRPKPAKECKRCGKRLYVARRQAERVAAAATAERGTVLRIYECPGGGWHITKLDKPRWVA